MKGFTLGQLFSKRSGVELPAYRYRFRQALRRFVARPIPQNFHLLLKLQAFRRGVRYTLRGGSVREEIHQLIRRALELPDGDRLSATLKQLRRLSKGDCGTARVQTTVREFLKNLPYYRSHLTHSNLGLPRTTNCVESMCRLLREMLRSSRAGSNPASVLLWATALFRLRSKMVCNGHHFNRNS